MRIYVPRTRSCSDERSAVTHAPKDLLAHTDARALRLRRDGVQYSAWLDQHSSAEALQSIKAAIQASPAEARKADIVPVVLQLCTSK